MNATGGAWVNHHTVSHERNNPERIGIVTTTPYPSGDAHQTGKASVSTMQYRQHPCRRGMGYAISTNLSGNPGATTMCALAKVPGVPDQLPWRPTFLQIGRPQNDYA